VTAPLLEGEDLHTWYGPSQVLHGVSLSVREGETVTLMGRNGMGKTTTVRSLLGLTPPRRGEVRVRGIRRTGTAPHLVARDGIALVPEGRGVFPTLTVRENLIMAARPGYRGRRSWTLERVLQTFPRLGQRLGHRGLQLSGGEQQMLSIGRALLTNPDLLVLDGATEGLAPLVRDEIWAVLRALRAEGTATLLIDKDVRRLLELGDRHLVLVKGRVVFSGTTAEWQARAEENLAHLRV
jgi:branched-chain amino acid transport system ATP-binding protein